MKIIAKVKFNDGFAYVLDQKIELEYEQLKDNSLIGFDKSKTFYDYYSYKIEKGFKAFGGREISLKMTDGTTRIIKDYWWSSSLIFSKKYFKNDNVSFIRVVANDENSLFNYFVFYEYYANKEAFEKLEKEYNGKIYEYKNLEKICRSKGEQKNAIKFKDYNGEFFNLFGRIINRKDLYRKIKSRNLKAKRLNKMKIYSVFRERFGNNWFSTSSQNMIKFTDEDVKIIKKGNNEKWKMGLAEE